MVVHLMWISQRILFYNKNAWIKGVFKDMKDDPIASAVTITSMSGEIVSSGIVVGSPHANTAEAKKTIHDEKKILLSRQFFSPQSQSQFKQLRTGTWLQSVSTVVLIFRLKLSCGALR